MALKRLTYFGSYCWGDAMHLDVETKKVHGWKLYYFGNYQVAAIYLKKEEEQSPVYILTNVEWQRDPRDMFFADAKLLGYIPTKLAVDGDPKLNDLVLEMYNNFSTPSLFTWFKKLFKK